MPSNGKPLLEVGNFMLLGNDYIYKHIIPGNSKKMHYGSTSYYGGKVVFHSQLGPSTRVNSAGSNQR